MRGCATPGRPQGKSVKILYISKSKGDVIRKKSAAALVHSTVARAVLVVFFVLLNIGKWVKETAAAMGTRGARPGLGEVKGRASRTTRHPKYTAGATQLEP